MPSKVTSYNVNPHDWAHWLTEIKKGSPNHKILVQKGEKIEFLEKKNVKDGHILKSKEIVEISKNFLKTNKANLLEKQEIVNGMQFITLRREDKFNKLGGFFKFFAKLFGVGKHLNTEKKELLDYRLRIQDAVNSHQPEIIGLKIAELRQQKYSLTYDRKQYNQEVYEIAKDLYRAEKDQKLGAKDSVLKELNRQLLELNPNLPKVRSIAKMFGEEALKPSLKETVSSLCDLYQIDQKKSLERDCQLFSCDPTEMQAVYVKRMIKSFKTDFSLSTVTAIENTWKEMLNNRSQESKELTIDQYQVIFIPHESKEEQAIYIKEEKLDTTGAHKEIFAATDYLKVKKAVERSELIVKEPILEFASDENEDEETMESMSETFTVTEKSTSSSEELTSLEQTLEGEEITSDVSDDDEEKTISDEEEDRTTVRISNEEEKTTEIVDNKIENQQEKKDLTLEKKEKAAKIDNFDNKQLDKKITDHEKEEIKTEKELTPEEKNEIEKSEAIEEFKREAEIAWSLRNPDGSFPTGIYPMIKIISSTGTAAIVEKRAYYQLEKLDKNGKPIRVKNLKEMAKKLREGYLSIKDQFVFLDMFEDFLKGLKALNDANLIHFDIKLDNVLCTKNGRAGIIDFGLTYKKDDPERNRFMGSPHYISPEVAVYLTGSVPTTVRKTELTSKVDIWAAGIACFAAFTGFKIYQHPAIGKKMKHPYQRVGNLIRQGIKAKNEITYPYKEKYENNFPKPKNEGFVSLIGECTKVFPEDRITHEQLIEKFQKIKKNLLESAERGEFTSIIDAIEAEE